MTKIKTLGLVFIVSLIFFGITEYFSVRNYLPVDGPLIKGFPFTYYFEPSRFGCFDNNSAECRTTINYEVVILNYLVHLVLTILIFFIYKNRNFFQKGNSYGSKQS